MDKILLLICKLLDSIFVFKYKKQVPVLLYHSVSKTDSKLAISPEIFEEQIKYLKDKGYKSIAPDNIKSKLDKKNILITFDDGFRDNLTIALPVLIKYGFVATIFITTKYIGGRSEYAGREEDRNFQMLSIEEIKRLEKEGWTICNHLHSHRNLIELNDEEIEDEFKKSCNILENISSGKENMKIISYPRNKKDKRVEDVLKNAGVKMAFSGATGFVKESSDLMDLPRIEIYSHTNIDKFKLYLNLSFYLLKRFLKR